MRVLNLPDGRQFLLLEGAGADAVDAALADLDGEVHAEIPDDDAGTLRMLTARGFEVARREHHYRVPTAGARPALPGGIGVVSAADADVDRWRELDDTLRQDVPGSAGWRNDPEGFAGQTFADPEFDPATYLIAVDEDGGYVGLVRVWNRPDVPRLGLIAVLPAWRRRGLGAALLGAAFDVLYRRGQAEVSCEVDETNTASDTLMRSLGARRVGGGVELVRRS